METEKNNRIDEISEERKTCLSDEEDIVFEIVLYLADMTVNNFERLMIGFNKDVKRQAVRTLRSFHTIDAINALKLMFIVGEMQEEADMFDILDICQKYDNETYDLFVDFFGDSMMSDWHYPIALFRETDEEDEDEWM